MELDSAKAVSPEGGKAVLFLGWPGLAGCFSGRGQQGTGDPGLVLALAESCQFQPCKGSHCAEGGLRWGCCTEVEEIGLRGTFGWSLLTGERGISNGYSGFSVVGNSQRIF